MSELIFQIPRQTDREVIAALGKVRDASGSYVALKLNVQLPKGTSEFPLDDASPTENASIKYVLEANGTLIDYFRLKGPTGHNYAFVQRQLNRITDEVHIPHDGWNHFNEQQRSHAWVVVLSNLRAELKAPDVEASLKGAEDSAWNRYRDAQLTILSSLEQTAQRLITDAAKHAAEADRERAARFETIETNLRAEIAEERTRLNAEFEGKNAALAEREKAITEREASFNTKEARYVARQKQDEQIKQIDKWLNEWKLTTGTEKKREPIFWAYVTALGFTACLTAFAVWHNYSIATTAADLTELQWWHWVLLTSKALFPLAAFTTFMIYFIRWSAAWARQHSEEEFRNRTRLIDIGRSAWLLEAVRDAQDRNKDLPADLLKELSRNLFTNATPGEPDVHPETGADILLQGLSSLRVKSPTGAEVEARRGKADK